MKFRKTTAFVTAALMAVAMMPAMAFADSSQQLEADTDYDDNELLVVYNDDASCTKKLEGETVDAIADDTSDKVEAITDKATEKLEDNADIEVKSSEFLANSIGDDGAVMHVKLKNNQDLEEAMDAIDEQSDVAYVQPNYTYDLMDDVEETTEALTDETTDEESETSAETEATTEGSLDTMTTSTNDTYRSVQYYLNDWSSKHGADVLNAWDSVKTNGSVTVAVLDSGIDPSHPDLQVSKGAYIPGANSSVRDMNGHGTHVAGIIGATANNSTGIAGASYNATVYPINVSYNSGGSKTSFLVAAYQHLDNLVESGEMTNLHVINISMGSYATDSNDTLLENAIAEMRNYHDVVTVCAGGNGDGKNGYTKKVYPADYAESVSVTSLDKNGNNSQFSDYNSCKDISAPGEVIASTYPTYNSDYAKDLGQGYCYMSGTSMAAPLVSGIMALLWAEYPDLTVDEAVEAIEATANPVNTSENNRGSKTGSAGAIDAAAAVKYVKSHESTYKKNVGKFKTSTTLSYSSCVYSGKAKTPAVTVKGLTAGTDYTVSYSNNVKVGSGVVTITGKGNYTGKIVKTFKINPKATKLRSLTRYTKAFRARWYKQATQTTGYQIQYSKYSTFSKYVIKTVSGTSSVSRKVTGLTKKCRYYVRVRTYKTVSGVRYYSSWSAKKSVKTK